MSQNFPLIPPGAAAKGSRVVGGVLCDLFEFVWPEDNRPVQMAVASSPQWPGLVGAPVRLMLPHNGRSVEYDEFTPDARASYSDLDWAAELEAFQQSCEKRLVCQYTEAYAAESAMRPLSALR
jgi:phage FluMu gp28-like protein